MNSKFHPCMLAKRIGALIRLLDSNFEGEAISAATKFPRLLPSEGLTIDAVAVLVENCNGRIETLKYSEDDAAIFARGLEKGRAEIRGHVLSADYFDDDGEPRWVKMVKFCRDSPAFVSLKPNERDFIDELPSKLARYGSPTRPSGGFLLSIFWKLGGAFK